MSGRKPFEDREQTGYTDNGTHDIVHVGCVDDHIGPVVAMLFIKVRLHVVTKVTATDLVGSSTADPRNLQRTFRP